MVVVVIGYVVTVFVNFVAAVYFILLVRFVVVIIFLVADVIFCCFLLTQFF